MKYKNKIVIVTGASTGIGRATSLAFSKEGATVLLVARREKKLQETKKIIEKTSGSAEIFVADLSDITSINYFIKSVKSKYTSVDILCNIAGIWHGENEVYADKSFESFSENVIIDTYMVGTIAPTLLAHAFIPLMQSGSSIINLSGTFESGAKGWLPYFVSKRAIEDLTVGLAEELKDKNIRVNGISPSDVGSEEYEKYFPQYIKDAIKPKEIANYELYLCSDEAKNITGKIIVLKKGKKPFDSFHY